MTDIPNHFLLADDPIEFLEDVIEVRKRLRGNKLYYVYVLHKPNKTPFYVGKGVGERVLNHEAEARNTPRLTHKLNVIRSIHKNGRRILYRLDSFFDSEPDAHARERT